VVVGLPMTGVEETMVSMYVWLGVVTAGALVVATLAGIVVIRRQLAPLASERDLRIQVVPTRVTQRADDVEVLHDRARPAVAEDQRKGAGLGREDMQEVHVRPVDGCRAQNRS
jgi:hypothetical protein